VKGSPFAAGTNACSVIVDPNGKFIDVPNYGSANVSVYTMKSDGALTQVKGSPFAAGSGACYGAVDPSDKFVYVGNSGAASISGYQIGSNGALTPLKGSPFPAGQTPAVIATCRVTSGKCVPPPL
jgi:6-phosphogluconolactonase (cycloisomerase 2 family)